MIEIVKSMSCVLCLKHLRIFILRNRDLDTKIFSDFREDFSIFSKRY